MSDWLKAMAHTLGQLASCSPGQLREMAKVVWAGVGFMLATAALVLVVRLAFVF